MDREHRLLLWNQLEILKYLDPAQRKNYEVSQETLSCGYTSHYSDVFRTVSEKEADKGMQQEVLDILDMFRALDKAKRRGWIPSDPSSSVFKGFDGKNDDHYGFADHLLGGRGLFAESAAAPRNSHSIGTLRRYRRLLAVWTHAADRHELTDVEAEATITA